MLVDLATGREVASAVYPYADGVIDQTLPGTAIRVDPDWALQNPGDYVEYFGRGGNDLMKRLRALRGAAVGSPHSNV